MTRFLIIGLLLFPGLVVSSDGTATCNTEKFSRGVLWEIRLAGSRPDYLFGTIHLEGIRLPDIVSQSLRAAEHYLMEVDLHPQAQALYTERSRLNGRKNLEQLLGAEGYAELSDLVTKHYRMEDAILRQLKPWAVFTLLSRPPSREGEELDFRLAKLAQQSNLEISGLETMGELLDALDGLPLVDQLAILRHTVKHFPELEKQRREMKEKYRQQDLAGMVRISMEGQDDALLFERFMDRLLYQRNARMLDRIESLFPRKEVFAAVGALHLPGERGLLCGLASRGYQIKRLY